MMMNRKPFVKASASELEFMRKNAPRGLWKMIQVKTRKSRSQVDYQLRLCPEKQNPIIIDAARELFHAATGLTYTEKSAK